LLSFFVHFAGFEGEYLSYLTEKRVKGAEKSDEKMVALLLTRASRETGGGRHSTPMESIVKEATKNYFSGKSRTATTYYPIGVNRSKSMKA